MAFRSYSAILASLLLSSLIAAPPAAVYRFHIARCSAQSADTRATAEPCGDPLRRSSLGRRGADSTRRR